MTRVGEAKLDMATKIQRRHKIEGFCVQSFLKTGTYPIKRLSLLAFWFPLQQKESFRLVYTSIPNLCYLWGVC